MAGRQPVVNVTTPDLREFQFELGLALDSAPVLLANARGVER